jgi:hypothetical protein
MLRESTIATLALCVLPLHFATAAGNITFAEVTTNLSGNLIFVDASLDGLLVNATNGSQTGINAGDSTTGNWGRADASTHAVGTTPAGHTDALRGNVLEGNTPAGLPVLKWTFKSGAGDGTNGGGNLKSNTTYQVYAHWLRYVAVKPAVELASNASLTGSVLIDTNNSGTGITSGTTQDWYRLLLTFSLTTDANGYASLWIRQPVNCRTIIDGIVMQEAVVRDPWIAVSPVSTNIGTFLPEPAPQSAMINVSNLGATQPLVISNNTAISGAGSAAFNIVTALPITIPAGGSTNIEVEFDPGATAGTYSANLDLRSNDPLDALKSVGLSATVQATLTFTDLTNGLSGNLIFVDASLDGTLVNATNESQTGINAGNSSSGNWGRVDSSYTAQGVTPDGHQHGLNLNVLEGNTAAGLPALKWTFRTGSGDGYKGGGTLKSNTTYQVYAHWLKYPSAAWAVELANNAAFTGADVMNSDYGGDAMTAGTPPNWSRFPTTFTVTTDADGYARLWIRQPPSNRAILDGVIMREGVVPTFNAWAAGYGIAADGNGDSDNDRISAMMEYALGFNPTQLDTMPLPLPSGTDYTVTWPKGAEASGDPKISYAVQVSTNLINWNPAAPGDVDESATNFVLTLVSVRERFFARLAVTYGTTSGGGRLTGTQPVSGWPTNVLELTYFSAADQTLQPALAYQALSNAPRPLLVALHTWSGNYLQSEPDYANWCISNDWHFIHPNFRGPNNNSNALGSELAVQDIVSAAEFMRANCNVDTNRIYLTGVSGGGHASLLLAGRHPEIWAGVSAWCGISDIAAWWQQCDGTANDGYANNIEAACGGSPATNAQALAQCIQRSPVTYLVQATNLALDINQGVNDGRTGSVPFTHALYAFNVVAAPADRLTEQQITNYYATQISPEPADPDPLYGSKPPLFRRVSDNTRVTIFNGGHEIISNAALRWLAEQRKGMPAQWTIP